MKEAIKQYMAKNGLQQFCPQTALFDMDGVLYDSMPNHAVAWHDSMKEYNLRISHEEAYLYEGMRGVETIKLLAQDQWKRDISDEEAQQMYVTKSEHYAKRATANLIPGVLDLQRYLREKKITIGVVTGSGQLSLIQRILRDFDGLVSPDVIVSAHDVNHGKPAPDPYLMGMQKAKSSPCDTIIVENAPLGVQAGIAAGCFTVAVNTGPLSDDILRKAGADIVFPDMNTFLNSLKDTLS